MTRRPYIVGNWKMHGTRAMLSEARAIDRAAQRHMKVEVALAPPYTLIHPIHREAEQIADELGSAREVVSRQLKRFENKGWVVLGRGYVEVINKEALQKIQQ